MQKREYVFEVIDLFVVLKNLNIWLFLLSYDEELDIGLHFSRKLSEQNLLTAFGSDSDQKGLSKYAHAFPEKLSITIQTRV